MRRRTGARSLLMGVCLGSLVEVFHDCEVDGKEGKKEREKESEGSERRR